MNSRVSFDEIDGLSLRIRQDHKDDRGLFCKFPAFSVGSVPKESTFYCAVSDNYLRGTLRGLHLQIEPFPEAKYVTSLSGSIFDVVVDLRPKSKTFLKWAGVNVGAADGTILCIPSGIAHGFQTLEDKTMVLYTIFGQYSPDHSRRINYGDTDLAIDWPIKVSNLSSEDRQASSLQSILNELLCEF